MHAFPWREGEAGPFAQPMKGDVDAATVPRAPSAVPALLVRHLAPPRPAAPRTPVKLRLEEALGQELADRLVSSLLPAPRRRP